MNLETTFLLISCFLILGLVQASFENLILVLKFPAIINYPLDKGIIKSSLAKKLSFLYNSPIITILLVLKLLIGLSFLIALSVDEVHFLMPLGLLLIDVIGFFRWKFLPSSDVPMQRVILISLTTHYYFHSPEISNIVLIAIVAFLSLSYVASGYKKVRSSNWRSGNVMLSFAVKGSLPFSTNMVLWKWVGYLVIFFECSFFIALLNTKLVILYLLAGFLFHLYLYVKHQFSFFFWTFVAAYPAFYYTAENMTIMIKNLTD